MYLLIWFGLGVVVGVVVRRVSIALGVAVTLWLTASFAGLTSPPDPLQTAPDTVSEYATLALAVLGCGIGALVQAQLPRLPNFDAGPGLEEEQDKDAAKDPDREG